MEKPLTSTVGNYCAAITCPSPPKSTVRPLLLQSSQTRLSKASFSIPSPQTLSTPPPAESFLLLLLGIRVGKGGSQALSNVTFSLI